MDERLEAEELSTSLEGLSDSEFSSQDSADEELYSEAGSQTKLQFRSVVFKACWNDELSMAEIMKHKGNLLKSMGINRNGEIYLSLKKHWRLGTPWSLKSVKSSTLVPENTSKNNNTTQILATGTSIVQKLNNLQLTEVSPSEDELPSTFKKTCPEKSRFVVHLPVYEVYLPNSQFKKTCPGNPNFVVYPTSGHPPSLSDIKKLERQSNELPLKIGHVDDGRVSLFSIDKMELPVLL